MALGADKAPHLLTGRVTVDVVVLDALALLERRDALSKAGRVIRSSIVSGSWQSMQDTGCSANWEASAYDILFILANPASRSPSPNSSMIVTVEVWQLRQAPGCLKFCTRSV
nr:hypothetical protein [Tessaracoccus coleopterorum]